MHPQTPRCSTAGFTLIELLIAMAMGLVILGATTQSFVTYRKIYSVQEHILEMQQTALAAMGFVTRELRMALTPIVLDTTAGSNAITYVSVLDSSQQRGFRHDSNDNILHYMQGALGLPRDALPSFQLSANVTDFTITQDGNQFTITLTVRSANYDPQLGAYRSFTLSSQVRPRNLAG